MSTSQLRAPAGSPDGGQFTAASGQEAAAEMGLGAYFGRGDLFDVDHPHLAAAVYALRDLNAAQVEAIRACRAAQCLSHLDELQAAQSRVRDGLREAGLLSIVDAATDFQDDEARAHEVEDLYDTEAIGAANDMLAVTAARHCGLLSDGDTDYVVLTEAWRRACPVPVLDDAA